MGYQGDESEQDRKGKDGDRDAASDHHRAHGGFIAVDIHNLRGAVGTAAGHQPDRLKLIERPNGRHEHRENDNVLNLRKRDVEEALNNARPVDSGGFVVFDLYGLQPCENGDPKERRPSPDVGDHHGQHGELGIAKPDKIRVDKPQGFQNVVRDADAGVEDPGPVVYNDKIGQCPGEHQNGPRQILPLKRLIQRKSHDRSEYRFTGDREEGESQGVPDRVQILFIGQKPLVVSQTNESRRIPDRLVRKAHIDAPDHRIQEDAGQIEDHGDVDLPGKPIIGLFQRGQNTLLMKKIFHFSRALRPAPFCKVPK